MRTMIVSLLLVMVVCAPAAAQEKQPFDILGQVVIEIIERENQGMETVRKY